jgi:hypothetical protein
MYCILSAESEDGVIIKKQERYTLIFNRKVVELTASYVFIPNDIMELIVLESELDISEISFQEAEGVIVVPEIFATSYTDEYKIKNLFEIVEGWKECQQC